MTLSTSGLIIVNSDAPRIYIASKLDNYERVVDLRDKFSARGVELSYDWTPHATVKPDDLKAVALAEFKGVREADCLLLVSPGGKGTHFELGVACSFNIPTALLLDRHDGYSPSFYSLIDDSWVFYDEASAIDFIVGFLND